MSLEEIFDFSISEPLDGEDDQLHFILDSYAFGDLDLDFDITETDVVKAYTSLKERMTYGNNNISNSEYHGLYTLVSNYCLSRIVRSEGDDRIKYLRIFMIAEDALEECGEGEVDLLVPNANFDSSEQLDQPYVDYLPDLEHKCAVIYGNFNNDTYLDEVINYGDPNIDYGDSHLVGNDHNDMISLGMRHFAFYDDLVVSSYLHDHVTQWQ